VKRGESLGDIADNFGIEVQDLKAWNHLHSNKAVVGQTLKVKESADEPEQKPEKVTHSNYVTYKVKTGDTLSGIASKFDANVEKIRELNGLKKGRLQPGMMIKINKG
jgi:membrane-bound lytic murein transglycosylase D